MTPILFVFTLPHHVHRLLIKAIQLPIENISLHATQSDVFINEVEVRGYVDQNTNIPHLKTLIYTSIEETISVSNMNDVYTPEVAKKSVEYQDIKQLYNIFSKHTKLSIGTKEHLLLLKYILYALPSNKAHSKNAYEYMELYMLKFPEYNFSKFRKKEDLFEHALVDIVYYLHSVLKRFCTSLLYEHTEQTEFWCSIIAQCTKRLLLHHSEQQFPYYTIMLEFLINEGYAEGDAICISFLIWKSITKTTPLIDQNLPVALDKEVCY